jgi:hypothetical protein
MPPLCQWPPRVQAGTWNCMGSSQASIILTGSSQVYPELVPEVEHALSPAVTSEQRVVLLKGLLQKTRLITAAMKPAATPKVAASEEVPSPPSSVASSPEKFVTPEGTPAPEESPLRRLLRRSSQVFSPLRLASGAWETVRDSLGQP